MPPLLSEVQESQVDSDYYQAVRPALEEPELQITDLPLHDECYTNSKDYYNHHNHDGLADTDGLEGKQDSVMACVEETQYVGIGPDSQPSNDIDQFVDDDNSFECSPQPNLSRQRSDQRPIADFYGSGSQMFKRDQKSLEISLAEFQFGPAPKPRPGQFGLKPVGNKASEPQLLAVAASNTDAPVVPDQQQPRKVHIATDKPPQSGMSVTCVQLAPVSRASNVPLHKFTTMPTDTTAETNLESAALEQAIGEKTMHMQAETPVQKSRHIQKSRQRIQKEPFPEVSLIPNRRTGRSEPSPSRSQNPPHMLQKQSSGSLHPHLPSPLSQVTSVYAEADAAINATRSGTELKPALLRSETDTSQKRTAQTGLRPPQGVASCASRELSTYNLLLVNGVIGVTVDEENYEKPTVQPGITAVPCTGTGTPNAGDHVHSGSAARSPSPAANQRLRRSSAGDPVQDMVGRPKGRTDRLEQINRPLRKQDLGSEGIPEEILHNLVHASRVRKPTGTPKAPASEHTRNSISPANEVTAQQDATSHMLTQLLKNAENIGATLEDHKKLVALSQEQVKHIEKLQDKEQQYEKQISHLQASKDLLKAKVDRLKKVAEGYHEHANAIAKSQNYLVKELANIKASAKDLEKDKQIVNSKLSKAEDLHRETLSLIRDVKNLIADKPGCDQLTKERDGYKINMEDAQKETNRLNIDMELIKKKTMRLQESLEKLGGENKLLRNELFAVKRKSRALESEVVGACILLEHQTQARKELRKELEAISTAHTGFLEMFRASRTGIVNELNEEDGVLGKLVCSQAIAQAKNQELVVVINAMNEREPTVPSVLSDLIESLYTRIESKLQATHDNTGILHDSDAKLLEKVQECLNQISADSETRSSLNSRIAELQSRNETLIADKVVRDRQLDSVLKTNQELQTSLSETQQRLVAIDLELQNTRSVPTDDPQLQARLQALESLQETLREQLEAAKRETAQANTQKSRLQDATLLAKEQLEETLIKLTDTQSLMETLKAENDNYVASAKDSTEKVRQEVAKAASASKAELEIRYKGLAKTLEQRRREAEDELNSVKETLHRMERETTNSSSVIVKLQEGLRNQNIQLQAQDTAIQRLKEQNVDMNIAHGDSLNQQQALKELAELREQIRTTQTQSRQISEDALRSQKDAEYKLNVFDAQQREKHLLQAENVNLVAFKAGLEIEKSNLQKTVDELRQSLNAGDDKLRKIKALEEDKASLELANRDLQMKIVQANHSHGHDRLQFRNIKSLEHAQIINGYHQGNASPRLHTQGLAGHTHSPLNTPSRNGDPKPSPLRNTTSNFQDRIVNSHPEASIATPTSNFASSVQEMGSQSSQALVEGTRILRAAVRKSNGMGKHQLLPVQQSQTKKRAEATTVIDQASMTLSNKFGFNSCLGTAKSIQGSTSMPPGVVIPYSSSLSPSKIEEQHTSDEIDELSTTLMDEQEDIKVMHGGSFVDNAIVETKSLTKNTPVIVTSELINSKDLSEVIIQTPKPAPSTTEEAARRRASQPLKSAMKLRATSNLLSDTKLADLVLSAEDGAQISNSILQEKATEKGINKNLLRAQSKGARVGSSYNRVVAGQSTKASCASADSNGHPTKQQTQASPRLKDTKKSPAMTVPRRNQSGKRQADSPIPPNKAVKAPRMSSTHTSDSKSKMVIPDTKCPDYQSADSQGSEYFPGSSALNPRYWGR